MITYEKTILEFHRLFYELYRNIWLLEVTHIQNGVMKDTTRNEIHTIEIIGGHKKVTMAELSRLANVKQSTMTGMVKKLVDKKFVKREKTDNDRRIVTIELTLKGKEAYIEHEKMHEVVTEFWLSGLNEAEKESLLQIMEKLTDLIDT